jgi:hypothetical protein
MLPGSRLARRFCWLFFFLNYNQKTSKWKSFLGDSAKVTQ